ncbi:MAG TPA: MBL fold metallo-hydrolase [Terriglobia bacterium]|nr:MBL fold metallo-hydrolase [Terriglobia bacterium]
MSGHKWKVDVLLQGNWRGASSVLLTGGSAPILVDSGMPHDAHQLVKALAERGLRPEEIPFVINTHFHLDHVSNNCLFPSSAIYATQLSSDWCRSLYSDFLANGHWEKLILKYYPETYEYENAADLIGKIRKIAQRWWDAKRAGTSCQFRWIEKHHLPDGIEAITTSGHVPGHVSLVVRNGSETTIIAGDALVTRTHDERVLTMIPHRRAQYLLDRKTILSIPGIIIPGHDQPFENQPCP